MNTREHITLKLNGLEIGYGAGKPVLKDISLMLNGGTVTGLIANNGTGKSTLLKTLAGNLTPLKGSIEINAKNISHYSHSELAKKVAIVLTEKPELAGFSVWDLVALGRFPYTNIFGHLADTDLHIIEKSLELCGITNLKTKNCNELSDGEFQKAMIARALAQQTDVLLLDEPTAFLDYSSKRSLFTLLKDIAEKENKVILVSSHDIETLLKYAHFVFVLKKENPPVLYPTPELQGKDPGLLFT